MTVETEMPRTIKADNVPKKGRTVPLQPSDEERAAVAKRLDLISLDMLEGHVTVQPEMGREMSVQGTVRAEVTQTCVVSGEPVTTKLEFDLFRMYAEDADPFSGLANGEDDVSDPDLEDPDPIIDGLIDVGEAVIEELALRIPLYPRAEGVEFNDSRYAIDATDVKENPFSALESLKNKIESNN